MDDPKVTIGGRAFAVPEYSGWALKKVCPRLSSVTSVDISNEESFDRFLQTVHFALTIQTTNNKKDGPKVNDITLEDFEELKIKPLQLAQDVLPTLLRQAGMQREDKNEGGAGVAPKTPLSGETSSTTSPPTSPAPSTAHGNPPSE